MSNIERRSLLNREDKIKLHPVEAYFDEEYNTEEEKKEIINKIISQIQIFKEQQNKLKVASQKLGNYISVRCSDCITSYVDSGKEWSEYLDEVATRNYFCMPSCQLKDVSDNEFYKLRDERDFEVYQTLMMEIKYKVALDQKKNLLKDAHQEIRGHKKERSILVFKKKSVTNVINTIQLSIIFVSTFITFFESIKKSFIMDSFISTIVPIVCSTYIALVLSIARFYKFDIRNERLGKVIERFSFIINKIRQKKRIYDKFDFKINTLDDWKNTMNLQEKDSIEDIIMKTNEERDLLMTLKEQVEYSKIYSKYKLKEVIESNNFTRARNLLANTKDIDKDYVYELNRLIKRKCGSSKYCCCFRREYVDYSFIEKFLDREQKKENRKEQEKTMNAHLKVMREMQQKTIEHYNSTHNLKPNNIKLKVIETETETETEKKKEEV